MRLISSVEITGENFLSDVFEKETGIVCSAKNVKGQIRTKGRYKNRPFPFGSASVKATDIDSEVDLEFGTFDVVVDFALKNKRMAFELGADSISIDVAIYHSGMGGWEITIEQISKLNKLGSNLLITYYDETE